MIEFYIDDREQDETFQYKLGEHGALRKHLPCHDVIVGAFGVERKEASDFISSVFDGRLREQQANASEVSEKRRILVVEGDIYRAMAFSRSGSFSVGLYWAALADMAAMGVTVVNTPDINGTIHYILALKNRAESPLTEIEQQVTKLKRVSTYEAMLRQVPTVGPAKAEKIMERWPSFSMLAQTATYGDFVRLLKPAAADALWVAVFGDKKKPRAYSILGDAKAAEVTLLFPEIEMDESADWDKVKAAFTTKVANTLWEKGLAERKGQTKVG